MAGHCSLSGAWLSLDENDNELALFLSYLVAAIQSLYPDACATTHRFLTAPQTTPPPDTLATTLLNEITDLPDNFALVLDDYHLIDDQAINRFVSTLVKHAPPSIHLVIISRQDVPFSVARLRASQTITEIRMADLRFSAEEVARYLDRCLDVNLSPEFAAVLAERTEGWPVGLRLACLSLQE